MYRCDFYGTTIIDIIAFVNGDTLPKTNRKTSSKLYSYPKNHGISKLVVWRSKRTLQKTHPNLAKSQGPVILWVMFIIIQKEPLFFKSLHKQLLFHQTSTKKWLFRVPGRSDFTPFTTGDFGKTHGSVALCRPRKPT